MEYEALEQEETPAGEQTHSHTHGPTSALWIRFSCVCNVFLLVAQAVLLNAFITKYGPSWMSGIGIAFSIVHLLLWIFLLPVIANSSKKAKNLLTIYWASYGLLQWVPHVCLIFTHLVHELDNSTFLGHHTLEGTLCLSPLIFLTLIYASYHRIPAERHEFLEKLILLVAIDIFDSVEILEFVFEFDHEGRFLPQALFGVIITLACLNIVFPTIALVELQRNRRGWKEEGKFFMIESILGLLLVNFPFMVIRGVFWVKYHQDVSTFMAKNIYFAIVEMREIGEFCLEVYRRREK